jgi:hypothetical protein
MDKSNHDYKQDFIKMKKNRRENKRTEKRCVTGEEVIFIFEKVLENWPTIRIYNTIIQNDPNSFIDKKKQKLLLQVIVEYMKGNYLGTDMNIMFFYEKRFMNTIKSNIISITII